MKNQGIVTRPEPHRSKVAAAFLNLIPGLAELAYLDLQDKAPGGHQMVCCALFPALPVNWFWSIPLAIHNTDIANIQHTIKAHLHEIPEELGGTLKTGPPDAEEPLLPEIIEKPGVREPVPKGTQPKVAVFNFDDKTPGAETNYGEIVAEFFHSAMFNTESFRLMEREQIMKILREQNFGTTDIVDKTKTIKIGKLLQVEYILVGSIAKMGTVYAINARMINVKTGETAAAAPTGKAEREEDIDSAVKSMADYLGAQFR
ncbi:MAG: CsgG/HfaB family protein [Planctomycetota bacterium]